MLIGISCAWVDVFFQCVQIAEKPKRAHDQTRVAIALSQLGKGFESHNYTKQIVEFWKRICDAAEVLLPRYTEEGNAFIGEGLIWESKEEDLPDIEAKRIARYLYFVQGN